MSRNWAGILVATTFLSVGALLGTLIGPGSVEAAKEATPAVPVKIAYVNIALVLRDYKKFVEDGKALNAKRQEFIAKIKPIREAFDVKAKEIKSSVDAEERETLEKEQKILKQELDKLDAEAQKTIGELTERAIVDTFQAIREAIADLAKERNLDVVECYQDVFTPDDNKKAAMAQLRLQPSGLIPFYVRKEFLVTQDVIDLLNKKNPSNALPKK